jgi:hypothetical protein
MKLGILADVHEQLDFLRRALAVFEREGVEQVVVLGDVYELGLRIGETAALLESAGAVGVWGNHDFGLCSNPTEEFRQQYGDRAVEVMSRFGPRLEIADCLFTHVEPWLDPERIEDLWYFEGAPDTPDRVAQSFAAVPQRVLFVGHFHRWFLASASGLHPWDGRAAVTLDPPSRFLVGVHAVVDGRCAVYETGSGLLVPFDLNEGR